MAGRVIDSDRKPETIMVGKDRKPYPRIDSFSHLDGFTNYQTVHQQGRQLAEVLAVEREQLARTGLYTDEGLRRQMAGRTREVIATIGKLRSGVTDPGRKAIESKRKDLVKQAVGYRDGDLRQELRDRELRDAVRAMGKGASKFLLTEAPADVRAAVVQQPAFVSGVREDTRAHVRDLLLRDRVGAELEELEERHELNELVTKALDLATHAAVVNAQVNAADLDDDESKKPAAA